MDVLTCSNTQCGQPLDGEDAFCGYCGTASPVPQYPAQDLQRPAPGPQYATPDPQYPTPWPGAVRQPTEALNGQPDARPAYTGAGAPFFEHEARRQPGPLNNTTRYLCAAAYLNNNFANRVIRQLMATRRAVAPSINLDLGPIIWHCQRARRNILIRNIVLFVLVFLWLFVSWQSVLFFLFYTFCLGWVLPRVRWKQRGLAMKILFVLLALYVLPGLIFLSLALVAVILLGLFASAYGS